MPTFRFEGPDGRKHEIEGPPGSTEEQALKILQQHVAAQSPPPEKYQAPPTPGLLRSAASGLIQGAGALGDVQAPRALLESQQPVDSNTYYGKLVDALNKARGALEMPRSDQIGNAVGMQPTQPQTGAERIVQGAASAIPGALMGGSLAGRTAMGVAPAANAVRAMGMAPTGAVSPISGGAQAAAGNALQSQLLQQGLKYGGTAAAHALGGPIGGAIAHVAPHIAKILRFP